MNSHVVPGWLQRFSLQVLARNEGLRDSALHWVLVWQAQYWGPRKSPIFTSFSFHQANGVSLHTVLPGVGGGMICVLWNYPFYPLQCVFLYYDALTRYCDFSPVFHSSCEGLFCMWVVIQVDVSVGGWSLQSHIPLSCSTPHLSLFFVLSTTGVKQHNN